jgi:hypothetical protein
MNLLILAIFKLQTSACSEASTITKPYKNKNPEAYLTTAATGNT